MSLIRSLLLGESIVNVGTTLQLILAPHYFLSFLVKGPAQITPATRTLTQWFGGAVVLATAPLLLAYPDPGPDESVNTVTSKRRLAYQTLAASEAALSLSATYSYLSGDSGMTDKALLTMSGLLGAFMSVRLFLLYGKPALMEPKASAKKSQ